MNLQPSMGHLNISQPDESENMEFLIDTFHVTDSDCN